MHTAIKHGLQIIMAFGLVHTTPQGKQQAGFLGYVKGFFYDVWLLHVLFLLLFSHWCVSVCF